MYVNAKEYNYTLHFLFQTITMSNTKTMILAIPTTVIGIDTPTITLLEFERCKPRVGAAVMLFEVCRRLVV